LRYLLNNRNNTQSCEDIIVVEESKVIANPKVLVLRRDVEHVFLCQREAEQVQVLCLMLGLA